MCCGEASEKTIWSMESELINSNSSTCYWCFLPLVVQEAVQVSRDENQNYREYTISSPASLSPGPYSPEPPSSPDRKGGRITPTSKRYDFATLCKSVDCMLAMLWPSIKPIYFSSFENKKRYWAECTSFFFLYTMKAVWWPQRLSSGSTIKVFWNHTISLINSLLTKNY